MQEKEIELGCALLGQIKKIVWLYSSGQKKIGSVGRIFFFF